MSERSSPNGPSNEARLTWVAASGRRSAVIRTDGARVATHVATPSGGSSLPIRAWPRPSPLISSPRPAASSSRPSSSMGASWWRIRAAVRSVPAGPRGQQRRGLGVAANPLLHAAETRQEPAVDHTQAPYRSPRDQAMRWVSRTTRPLPAWWRKRPASRTSRSVAAAGSRHDVQPVPLVCYRHRGEEPPLLRGRPARECRPLDGRDPSADVGPELADLRAPPGRR